MVSVAVCDDVVQECADLSKRIKGILEKRGIDAVVEQFYAGRDLFSSGGTFDIVFLDIRMPEINGMDLAGRLREKEPDNILIFVTSVKEYVFEAYNVEAFQYLVKPVSEEKLAEVLLHAAGRLGRMKNADFIVVSSQRVRRKILLRDIIYIEAVGRLVRIHCRQDVAETYERIGDLENKLRDKDFFRCHKGYLINLRYVRSFERAQIVMENGEKIMLAKRRYEEFTHEILRYMKREGGIL